MNDSRGEVSWKSKWLDSIRVLSSTSDNGALRKLLPRIEEWEQQQASVSVLIDELKQSLEEATLELGRITNGLAEVRESAKVGSLQREKREIWQSRYDAVADLLAGLCAMAQAWQDVSPDSGDALHRESSHREPPLREP